MTKWIKFSDEEMAAIQTREPGLSGVAMRYHVSPYDVPESVVGTYDKGSRKFSIQFRYSQGEEPLEEVAGSGKIRVLVGKVSKRLYKIVADAETSSVGVVTALDSLKREERLADNYGIAKHVIERRGTELLDLRSY